MEIRPAVLSDCRVVAELALMAGEGIPAFFWAQNQQPGQDIIDVGASNLRSETENFSYRNVHVAIIGGEIAGMLLAYRLPEADAAENLDELPEFIRPLVELEQCVPGSFYINMVATFPAHRNRSVGSALMGMVDQLAIKAGCDEISIEVFEQNEGALRLYKRLGYTQKATRDIIPHSSHPYQGKIVLLTRPVNAQA